MNYTEISSIEYGKVLSSKNPVPGGGSVSAMVGALSASLAAMVANLTIGKNKYKDYQLDMESLLEEAIALRDDLYKLVQEDTEVFEPLSKAYGMDSSTEEAKLEKEKVMEDALNRACSVPLRIIELSAKTIELHKVAMEKGNTLAISDAGVGASLAKSAMESGLLNVYINTKFMKNQTTAKQLNEKSEEIVKKYSVLADEIYDKVREFLR